MEDMRKSLYMWRPNLLVSLSFRERKSMFVKDLLGFRERAEKLGLGFKLKTYKEYEGILDK